MPTPDDIPPSPAENVFRRMQSLPAGPAVVGPAVVAFVGDEREADPARRTLSPERFAKVAGLIHRYRNWSEAYCAEVAVASLNDAADALPEDDPRRYELLRQVGAYLTAEAAEESRRPPPEPPAAGPDESADDGWDEFESLWAMGFDELEAKRAEPALAVRSGDAMGDHLGALAELICDQWGWCRRRDEAELREPAALVRAVADVIAASAVRLPYPPMVAAVWLVKWGLDRLCGIDDSTGGRGATG